MMSLLQKLLGRMCLGLCINVFKTAILTIITSLHGKPFLVQLNFLLRMVRVPTIMHDLVKMVGHWRHS